MNRTLNDLADELAARRNLLRRAARARNEVASLRAIQEVLRLTERRLAPIRAELHEPGIEWAMIDECRALMVQLAYRIDPLSIARKIRAVSELIDVLRDLAEPVEIAGPHARSASS
jgi:hypothetical protein